MKTNLAKYGNVILLILAVILISSCAKPNIYRDDAVRIKAGRELEAYKLMDNPSSNTGNTLRGEVVKIEVIATPDSCPINQYTKYDSKTFILFIDSFYKDTKEVKRIPIEYVELIGPKLNISKNQYGNINFFETFNNPLLPKEIREVQVDTVFKDPCSTPCPCEPISIGIPCLFCFQCPDRILDDWFVSLKAGIAIFDDIDKRGNTFGRDDGFLDLAGGLRLGSSKRLGLGIMASTGINTMNQLDSTMYLRPSVNFYLRYDLVRQIEKVSKSKLIESTGIYIDTILTKTYDGCFDSLIFQPRIDCCAKLKEVTEIEEIEKRQCLNPFLYGFVGSSLDKLSLDLWKVNLNKDCEVKDEPLPINFGFGIGIEYPLSKHLDLSIDLGYRSISFGSQEVYNGLIIPTKRTVDVLAFRIGLVF